MTLSKALKVKDCSYVRINMGPISGPDDTVTISCPKSPLSDQTTLGFLQFKGDHLKTIEFIYPLNQKSVTMYVEADKIELQDIQRLTGENIPARPKLRTSYALEKSDEFALLIKKSILNKDFMALYKKLVEFYGEPSFASKSDELSSLFLGNAQGSGFASWLAEPKWMSVRSNFIVGSDGAKFVSLMISSKNY